MVPESHEVDFTAKPELKEYLQSPEFQTEVVEKLKSQYVVDITLKEVADPPADQADTVTYILSYTLYGSS